MPCEIFVSGLVLPVVALHSHLLAAIAFDRNSTIFLLDFERPAGSKIAYTEEGWEELLHIEQKTR
jgi:hypothetical protein